jgi:small subunit ribosomal protein S8e
MPQWHSDSKKRKFTGGKKKLYKKKKLREMASDATETRFGTFSRSIVRVRGNNKKTKLLSDEYANVTDQSTGLTKKVKILRVVNNPVNLDYDRRDIITKKTVIETSIGKAVVTSRPGQVGEINAVLIN